jgi:hypothetical protein
MAATQVQRHKGIKKVEWMLRGLMQRIGETTLRLFSFEPEQLQKNGNRLLCLSSYRYKNFDFPLPGYYN